MVNATSQTRIRQIALLVEALPAAERLVISHNLPGTQPGRLLLWTAVLGTEVIFRDARVAKWA